MSRVEAYMSRFDDVQQFVREANRVTEFDELSRLLDGTIRGFGFDYFALVHHASVFKSREALLSLHDFPDAWLGIFRDRGYFFDDPVLVACEKSAVPFVWSDVPGLVAMTPKQREVLEAAKEAGLGGGYTIPIHLPGDGTAVCTFSTKVGRELPKASFPAAQYVGCFAFEAARRVAKFKVPVKPGLIQEVKPPQLTRRQLDCVVLAGRGKSDRDVAQILGISDQTVHQHMEEAKRRYDVATRMQLIVRVLYDNHVVFGDLLN
jgi:LuxR family quorum-sensing system transcriptional regulator CciR